MGILNNKQGIEGVEKITVSSFCRRRLPVVLQRLKFSETLREAITFIEQGRNPYHKPDIRIGTELVTDPAFLVTRNMEDHINWVDSSSIKKKIMKYNDKLDDYELLE